MKIRKDEILCRIPGFHLKYFQKKKKKKEEEQKKEEDKIEQ